MGRRDIGTCSSWCPVGSTVARNTHEHIEYAAGGLVITATTASATPAGEAVDRRRVDQLRGETVTGEPGSGREEPSATPQQMIRSENHTPEMLALIRSDPVLALQRSFSFQSCTYAAVSCGIGSPARSAAGGTG